MLAKMGEGEERQVFKAMRTSRQSFGWGGGVLSSSHVPRKRGHHLMCVVPPLCAASPQPWASELNSGEDVPTYYLPNLCILWTGGWMPSMFPMYIRSSITAARDQMLTLPCLATYCRSLYGALAPEERPLCPDGYDQPLQQGLAEQCKSRQFSRWWIFHAGADKDRGSGNGMKGIG